MKNDDQNKKLIKLLELKSANKTPSKNQISKYLSNNKLNSSNLTNSYISKFDENKSINSEKQEKFNNSSNKLIYKDLNDKSINQINDSHSLNSFMRKKVGITDNRHKTPNKNEFNSTNKSKTTKKLYRLSSAINLSNRKISNCLFDSKNIDLSNNSDISKIEIINNKGNTIKIGNINNIQNYNSYHIIKRNNQINKKENFNIKELTNIINVNPSRSPNNKSEKSTNNEYQKNLYKRKISNNNLKDLENISSTLGDSNPVKVVVRFRPMNAVENEMLFRNLGKQCVEFKSEDTIEILTANEKIFTFDRVFNTNASQTEIFDCIAKPLIDDVLKGYNGTIFTYGQSGSGKTYTMFGEDILDESTQGIIPRAIIEIFNFINEEKNQEIKFELKFSMLEIYMENLYDLLNPDMKSSDLKIKEHSKHGIYVENLSETYITSQEEFLLLIHEAEKCRSVSETSLNKNSSRSHLLFQLQITQKLQDDTERRGSLNMIDLAGSEKISKTHAIGTTLEEARKINLSLSNLGNVIYALASNNDHIPYRDSKLTRILQDSLGGNSKTMLIVNCSVHSYNAEETLSTLLFAKRAKKIKNKVKINIKRSNEQLEAIIEYLKIKLKNANDEIEKLKGNSISFIQGESLNFLNENINNINNHNNISKNFDDNANEIPKKNYSYNSIGNNNDDGNFELNINNKIKFDILSELKRKNSNQNYAEYNSDLYEKIMESNNNLDQNKEEILKKQINYKEKNSDDLNSAKFEYKLNFEKERKEFEREIKSKNKEIENLKVEIGKLEKENVQLKEKMDEIIRENNIEKFIMQVENTMKEFIKDLTNSYDNIKENELNMLKENLVELKVYQIEMESKYLDIVNKITEFKEADFCEKLNQLNSKSNNSKNNLRLNKSNFNLQKYPEQSSNNNKDNNNCINKIPTYKKDEKSTLNNLKLFNTDKNEIQEKEFFQNFENDLELSINSCNKIDIEVKDSSPSMNTIKLKLKRDICDKNDSIFINDNNDLNILNTNFLNVIEKDRNDKSIPIIGAYENIIMPRDRSPNLNNKISSANSIKNDLACAYNNSNKETKKINQNSVNNNISQRKNTFNFEYSEGAYQFTGHIKNKSVDNKFYQVELDSNSIEDPSQGKTNKDIISKTNNLSSNNMKNNNQFYSNENLQETTSKIVNTNSKGNNNIQLLQTNYKFHLSCEELFKKIEKNLKNFDVNKISYKQESQKANSLEDNSMLKDKSDIKTTKTNESKNIIKQKEDLNNLSSSIKAQENMNRDYYSNIILSYKKIFEKNSFYSQKILDEFLRNSEKEDLRDNKEDENDEILFFNKLKNNSNCNNNYIDENKSILKTLDKKCDYYTNNNLNHINNSTINDDFLSVNDITERKDQNKTLFDANNTEIKKDFNSNVNKNNNFAIDNYLTDDRNLNGDTKFITKLKKGFVSLMLKNIYHEKINLELLSRLSIDLKIFSNETLYRKKLMKNLPWFISIFESYLNLLEDLKKMKFRKEFQVSKITSSFQPLLNKNNQNNQNFRNSLEKDENYTLHEQYQNLNKSIESIKNVLENDEKISLSSSPNNFKSNGDKLKINNTINKDKGNLNSPNFYYNPVLTSIGSNNLSNLNGNKRGSHNVVKSVSRHPSLLQSNITFCNYSLLLNSKNANNHNLDNNMNNLNQNQFICQHCKCINYINDNNNMNNVLNNDHNNVSPFKLAYSKNNCNNNHQINCEILNSDCYKNLSLNDKTICLEVSPKEDYLNKNLKQEIKEEIHSLNKMEKNSEFELIKNNKNQNTIKVKNAKCEDINSIYLSHSNTPVELKTVKIISPNNLNNKNLLKSERTSLKGRCEIYKNSIISNASNMINNDDAFCFSELNSLRKEISLYKNCFDYMTHEFNDYKFNEKYKEEALEKFYEENKIIFEKEVSCFWKALKVYKEIFIDQIKNKEQKINEMSRVFDDIVIGENSNLLSNNLNLFSNMNLNTIGVTDTNSVFNGEKNDTSKIKEEFLKNLAIKRKNQILNVNITKDNDFLKLAEAFYKVEGTATKKLDYVTIELNDSPDIVKLKYGSGLNKNIPTKSPLNRGFTGSLIGDEGIENLTSEEK